MRAPRRRPLDEALPLPRAAASAAPGARGVSYSAFPSPAFSGMGDTPHCTIVTSMVAPEMAAAESGPVSSSESSAGDTPTVGGGCDATSEAGSWMTPAAPDAGTGVHGKSLGTDMFHAPSTPVGRRETTMESAGPQ